MMHSNLNRDPDCASLDARRRRMIAETLGDTPRAALSALVDYGLNDQDIARYHRLPRQLVTELRELWRIPPAT